MNERRYEIVGHTADIAIKVYGKDLRGLFCNAAYGMFDIIADLEGLKPTTSINVELQAQDKEDLLVTWLDELLYNFYTKSIIFSEFKLLELNHTHLKAEVFGRHIGDNRSRLKVEIKAATYHGLKIEKDNRGYYSVQIIFDV